MKNIVFTLLVLGVVVFPTPGAQAQNSGLIDVFDDWSAFAITQEGKRVCYIGSEPVKSSGKYSRRGDVLFLVTRRPADKSPGEVNFQTGYTFRTGGDAELSIGGNKFSLFTDGEDAWARDGKTDRAIIEAMIEGARMVVEGVSSRGTRTIDVFSLKGFTAAHRAAGKACKQ